MKIALAADHAGFALKEKLRGMLQQHGHEVTDFGTTSEESTDYPDYAGKVARNVADGHAERGILVCSTGVGMSMAANKVAGIRAALAVSPDEVRLTRAHNNANVLTLGSRFTDENSATEMVGIFLDTDFEGGRHARRVAKMTDMERTGGSLAEGPVSLPGQNR